MTRKKVNANNQIDISKLVIVLLILLIAVVFLTKPRPIFPDALSLTILKVPELEEQATLSFVTTADAARIVYPFHWDLKEDARIGNKTVFSIKLYPEYALRIEKSEKVVVEGYHGIGDWSRHEFNSLPKTFWKVDKIDTAANRLVVHLPMNGTVNASDMLMWTTVPRTRVGIPGARAGAWIKRSNGQRGGYWPMKLTEPIQDSIQMGMEIPPEAIIDISQETLVKILKQKTGVCNMVFGNHGEFYVTEVSGNLTEMAGQLLGKQG